MNYYLVKSEPETYSWEMFLKEKNTSWTGVRNYEARNNLRAMKKGDSVLFYHSGDAKEIVGIAKVVKEFYQDPTTEEIAWVTVDVSPLKSLKKPVSLTQLKANTILKNTKLVRQPRISVHTLTKEEFDVIVEMSK
ncbi:MAG: EVE domain-containing protein [Ignavibacteriales bacterium]|nr:EVE domain-containing protein [Ignavibacteriales bacterium]